MNSDLLMKKYPETASELQEKHKTNPFPGKCWFWFLFRKYFLQNPLSSSLHDCCLLLETSPAHREPHWAAGNPWIQAGCCRCNLEQTAAMTVLCYEVCLRHCGECMRRAVSMSSATSLSFKTSQVNAEVSKKKKNKLLKCGFIFLFGDHKISLPLWLAVTLMRHHKCAREEISLASGLIFHHENERESSVSARSRITPVCSELRHSTLAWSQSNLSHTGWDHPSFFVDLQMQNLFSLRLEWTFSKPWSGNSSLDLLSSNLTVFDKWRWPNNTDTDL